MNETITYDKLGHCCLCHKEIAEYPEINGHKVLKWSKDRRECLFKLSNESVLHASMCAPCDDGLDRKQFMDVMTSIVKGWEKELESSSMPEEQKQDYRTNYYRLNIVERI